MAKLAICREFKTRKNKMAKFGNAVARRLGAIRWRYFPIFRFYNVPGSFAVRLQTREYLPQRSIDVSRIIFINLQLTTQLQTPSSYTYVHNVYVYRYKFYNCMSDQNSAFYHSVVEFIDRSATTLLKFISPNTFRLRERLDLPTFVNFRLGNLGQMVGEMREHETSRIEKLFVFFDFRKLR